MGNLTKLYLNLPDPPKKRFIRFDHEGFKEWCDHMLFTKKSYKYGLLWAIGLVKMESMGDISRRDMLYRFVYSQRSALDEYREQDDYIADDKDYVYFRRNTNLFRIVFAPASLFFLLLGWSFHLAINAILMPFALIYNTKIGGV